MVEEVDSCGEWKTYLVWFKQKLSFTGYCYAELESLVDMLGGVKPS